RTPPESSESSRRSAGSRRRARSLLCRGSPHGLGRARHPSRPPSLVRALEGEPMSVQVTPHPAWVGGHLHRHWFSFQGANEKIDNRPAGGKCTTSPPPDKFMGPWKVLHS